MRYLIVLLGRIPTAIRFPSLLIGVLVTFSSAGASPSGERNFAQAADYFRSSCPINLSEKMFREFYGAVGAKVQEANKNLPFAVGAILQNKGIIGTYYRRPLKCCLSMINVDREAFISAMSERLGLRGMKRIKVTAHKSALLFQPAYSNRMIAMDWDESIKDKLTSVNICHAEFPAAEEEYKKHRN
jgi:hypothetical protein